MDGQNWYGVYRAGGTVKVGPTRATEEVARKAAAGEKGNARGITTIQAENKAAARAQFEDSGAADAPATTTTTTTTAKGKAVTKPRAKRTPKVDDVVPLTEEEVAKAEAKVTKAGQFPFRMSRAGMAFHPRYKTPGGIFDILALDTPDLEDIGGDQWSADRVGTVRQRPLTGLHSLSCALPTAKAS